MKTGMDPYNRDDALERHAHQLHGQLKAKDLLGIMRSAGEAWSRFCLEWNLGRDLPDETSLREALLDIQSKVSQALSKLPLRQTPVKRFRRIRITTTVSGVRGVRFAPPTGKNKVSDGEAPGTTRSNTPSSRSASASSEADQVSECMDPQRTAPDVHRKRRVHG